MVVLGILAGGAYGRAQAEIRLEDLQAIHEARLKIAAERRPVPNVGVYEDYKAVLHVHAEDAKHTGGTRMQVLEAAKKTGVRIVFWTDHRGPLPETWRGMRDGVLFVAGSEDDNGTLRFPGETNELSSVALKFLSHIEERYDAPADGLDGMEISNRHTDAVLDKSLENFLRDSAGDPARWSLVAEMVKRYPDELFACATSYQAKILGKWDLITSARPFVGIGANDAHQNQTIAGITFDPYEVSFRNLSTHILARELTEPSVRQSLAEGHVYVSHDWLCDPAGFAFGAVNNLGVFPMGDPVPMAGATRLMALAPVPARFKLLHNGKVVYESSGTNLNFSAKELGTYRVEAWLTVAGTERPWIYSNPVYLKNALYGMPALPSFEVDPGVELRKGIRYGTDDQEEKQKLDVYIPKGASRAPVFFFIHGGAWRSGDRSQYVALGNRFAKAGFLTVVPSYRLAPKRPHPAQIEDVAAALAWVRRQIADLGGNPEELYVGGHSAGGHLAALLALDSKYLQAHQLSPAIIRKVIALSGVFNLAESESQSSVFGKEPEPRRRASPLFHVNAGAPSFLITYCEWDYPTLPAQARQFHSALEAAGVSSELVYIPKLNHISEMLNVSAASDPTVRAILKFLAVP